MGGSKSPEEILAGYIEAMGQELGELFRAASSELTWMHWRWKQYRTLFGEKPSRIDLLNEAAPLFFRIVQDVFFEDTLLAIARLVGSSQSRNKPNLTVQRFPPLLADLSLRDQVSELIGKAKTSAAFAVDWRNRRLAHRDLDLVLGARPKPLPPATRQKVEKSLSALRDVLNHIEMKYCNATTEYAYSPTLGDAEEVLYVIRDGLLREREKRERWNRGELRDEDTKPPEAI
jgi:HEPN superfamily AbiU2-like protein